MPSSVSTASGSTSPPPPERSPFAVVIRSAPFRGRAAIGSQIAMAFALRQLGKDVRVVSRDAPPAPLLVTPHVVPLPIIPLAGGMQLRFHVRKQRVPSHCSSLEAASKRVKLRQRGLHRRTLMPSSRVTAIPNTSNRIKRCQTEHSLRGA